LQPLDANRRELERNAASRARHVDRWAPFDSGVLCRNVVEAAPLRILSLVGAIDGDLVVRLGKGLAHPKSVTWPPVRAAITRQDF
jgi:hypothetical protein